MAGAGVLIPPVRVTTILMLDDTKEDHYNPTITINSICMFGESGQQSINFALLGGHSALWCFPSKRQRDLAIQGIYDQLGVIE